jgi:phosphoglycerate dehydrogenase-like enzyme
MRVAILDDYQQISLASTDWSTVRSLGQIDVFAEHIRRTEALVSALEPYDVVVAMRERTPFDADRLGQLPRLRLLVTTGMGNTSIDLEAAAARGITVCGTGGIGSSTAELTWGLILALLRHIPEEDKRLKLAGRAGGAALGVGGSWQRTVGTGLDGKRLGVVGLGHQGRRVADIGRAFGMKVVAWSQNLDPDVAKKAHAKAVSKEELFSSSDVVTVHYKLSPRSVALVGAAELALMKPSAYLVNTSRGPLVDSAALLAALRSGAIAGAALDVYDVEPLPLSDPLRSAPNVVLTPHLGYVTEETYQVFYGDAAEDIVAFAEGSPVRVLTASLFLARRLPARVAAGQGQGTFEGRRVPRRLDGVGETVVLAEEFGLGLDDVLQGGGRLGVCVEVLAGGPGHVPAVQGHLHEEHRAYVGGRGGVAHDVACAGPGFGG